MTTTDHLIINPPYGVPERHLDYDRERRTFRVLEGRRPAGYLVASETSRAFDDPGVLVELPLVNRIRKRVDAWRAAGYPGVTAVTKKLLEHWVSEEQRELRLFFCQLEAIETLIWLRESPPSERQGLDMPSDGGAFQRLCSKMATGSGKTIVMAMLIAWHVLNKASYPQDPRFSRHVLVVAPGLTVKSRLRVLHPAAEESYYRAFDLVPSAMFDKLRQGVVRVLNWHVLSPLDPEARPRVVKKGPESDEAFVKRILPEFGGARNLLVINDEAHHAWRLPPKGGVKGVSKDELEEATVWVSGLDRLDRARGILVCHDFTATPFAPTGKRSTHETLFEWIVSDFGLNDAIESGLVKTPRVVVRDDGEPEAREMKSKFYHLYLNEDVRGDLNRRAKATEPLPDLVTMAYYFLGKDWRETKEAWAAAGAPTPPVMITVCNRTETAARVEHAFNKGKIRIAELKAPERTLRIDTKALEEAERQDVPEKVDPERLTKRAQAELLRRTVDTVGQPGEPGAQIQNVIAVNMLSEGWDAKTVTHIMGLRAFTSQLLCEQVVGRGLRRTSYDVGEDGLFEAEYVNIFGVPFTFLPHEGGEGTPPPPPKPKTRIFVDEEKREHEITWPNVIRINRAYRPRLDLDLERVEPLELIPRKTPIRADLAPVVGGKPDITKLTEIDLAKLDEVMRKQRQVFEAARDVFEVMEAEWRGDKGVLMMHLVKLTEAFLDSDKLVIGTSAYRTGVRRRLLILLNLNRVVQHLLTAINYQNTERSLPVFDKETPLLSTGRMITWYTSKPCEPTSKSHISHVVYDSGWEAAEAYALEKSPLVASYAKNDHLGFAVNYIHRGAVRRYFPDFLIRLANGTMLVLEVKGVDDEKSKTKRAYLDEWVRAVNEDGRFGTWAAAVSYRPGDVHDILKKHGA